MRIAMVEDDAHLAELIRLWLREEGFECQIFDCAKAFQRALSRDSFDLLIIDWLLPDINGDEVLVWVRKNLDWAVPVLFVTQRDSEEDIVRALGLGADDFMSKPVRHAELIARVKALHRRAQVINENREGILDLPPFRIDPGNRQLEVNGQATDLTQKEFDLALFLFRNTGRVVSRAHILEAVWGHEGLNTRTVDTHVSRIRSKLDLSPENGWRLSAIYQHGYRLEQLTHEERAAG